MPLGELVELIAERGGHPIEVPSALRQRPMTVARRRTPWRFVLAELAEQVGCTVEEERAGVARLVPRGE